MNSNLNPHKDCGGKPFLHVNGWISCDKCGYHWPDDEPAFGFDAGPGGPDEDLVVDMWNKENPLPDEAQP